jgi:hydroxyethylthiazole kinase-like uncharacterized protein yjeF
MQRAGSAVARLALAVAPHARTVEVACGPGNNGGDGLVAATALHALGRSVRVLLLDGPGPAPADAAWALQCAVTAGVPIVRDAGRLDDGDTVDLFIDALLGLGSTRPPKGVMAAWVERQRGRPTLAVDLPSGLDVDTGTTWGGGHAVQATHTLSLLTLKPGLFTAFGRDHAGQVWLDTLGFQADATTACATLCCGADCAGGARPHASHKGSFGDLLVIGGAPGMTGAAALAANAALAAGAGRVYVSLLADGVPLPHGSRAELMQRERWWTADADVLRAATVVCGCGGGLAVAHALPPLLDHVGQLVLDADALNAVAADPALFALLAERERRGQLSVLTPHPLEAARLLGTSTAEVMANRLRAACTLADRLRCVVVLKGSGSVVAAPGRRPSINSSGNATLATPGTGDVLAGWIGGMLAAGTPARPLAGAAAMLQRGFATAQLTVWLHGLAADLAVAASSPDETPRAPLRAHDLIEAMHRAWASAPAP